MPQFIFIWHHFKGACVDYLPLIAASASSWLISSCAASFSSWPTKVSALLALYWRGLRSTSRLAASFGWCTQWPASLIHSSLVLVALGRAWQGWMLCTQYSQVTSIAILLCIAFVCIHRIGLLLSPVAFMNIHLLVLLMRPALHTCFMSWRDFHVQALLTLILFSVNPMRASRYWNSSMTYRSAISGLDTVHRVERHRIGLLWVDL